MVAYPQNLVWPLAPNWRERYSVAYEFKTDIFTSRSGKEQRRAQRTTPRKAAKFTITRTADEARSFSRFMTLYQGPLVLMADSSRFVRLTASADVSDTVLHVDSVAVPWLAGAQTVMLYQAGRYVAASIQSVDAVANTVTLAAPTGYAWPAGVKLHPAMNGTFDTSVSVKNYQDRTIEADISFRVDPGTAIPDDAASPIEVFNKREVFTFRPDTSQPTDGSFKRTVDVVDFGRGRIETYLPVAFSTRVKRHQIIAPTQADRAAVVAFFMRMKGQRGEFYMPSYEDDFTPVAADATTATFAGTLLADVYQQDDVHRAVMVVDRNGARYYRRIVGATASGGNTVLTTDVPWPCAIDQRVRVSWLLVHRFAVDLLTMDCITDEVGQAQISVTSLEDLAVSAPDSLFDELDDAAAWVLDNWSIGNTAHFADSLDFLINTEYPYITNSVGVVGVNAAAFGLAADLSKYVRLAARHS